MEDVRHRSNHYYEGNVFSNEKVIQIIMKFDFIELSRSSIYSVAHSKTRHEIVNWCGTKKNSLLIINLCINKIFQ